VDDDDNEPDVLGFYTETLTSLSVAYDLWDTGNSDTVEPGSSELENYQAVIWFSGDAVGGSGSAGPGTAAETALGTWLDQSYGCLMVSSQDYYADKGLTSFMVEYLGVSNVSENESYENVTGQGSVYTGLGDFSLSYPFGIWSDGLNPDISAETAFTYNETQGNAAVNKTNGIYRTTYLGFPFEAFSTPADRQSVMARFLNWCGFNYAVYLPLIIR
jgi:hypothetical protein